MVRPMPSHALFAEISELQTTLVLVQTVIRRLPQTKGNRELLHRFDTAKTELLYQLDEIGLALAEA